MKILIFSQNPKLPSGMARVGSEIAKQLSKYHEVIYQAQSGNEYGEDWHGCELWGNPISGGEMDVGMQILAQRVRQVKPDVFFTNLNYHQLNGLPPVLNGTHTQIDKKVMCIIHSAIESTRPVPGLYRMIIEGHKNDVYFVPFTKSHLEMWKEDREMKDFVPTYIPHGVDHSVFREHPPSVVDQFRRQTTNLSPDNFVFLFVGENWRRKRIDLMLEAFRKFKEEANGNSKMVLCTSPGPSHGNSLFYGGWNIASGPQSPQPDLLLESTGLKLGEDVIMVKMSPVTRMPDEQLAQMYSAADCLVLPTMAEGFGLPLIEAGACGTSSIVTDTPNTRWVIGNGALFIDTVQNNYLRMGAVLKEPSVEDMKEKMLRIYEDDELRSELADNAKERASDFSWRRTGREFVELIDKYEDGELLQKRTIESKKIGEEVDITMEELTEDEGQGTEE